MSDSIRLADLVPSDEDYQIQPCPNCKGKCYVRRKISIGLSAVYCGKPFEGACGYRGPNGSTNRQAIELHDAICHPAHPQPLIDAEAIDATARLLAESIDFTADRVEARAVFNKMLPDILKQHSQERAGWVLVPREPTKEMIQAGDDSRIWAEEDGAITENTELAWKAMLSAAPTGEKP